jgi:hypothetical protein
MQTVVNTLGTGYLNCLYAYKRKSASPVLNVLKSMFDNRLFINLFSDIFSSVQNIHYETGE